jgi:MFS family permease
LERRLTSTPSAAAASRDTRRVLFASLVGASVEFYDYYIYATAASLVLGQLFFPSSSAWAQQLAAYASLGLAFVARPLGAVVFGHFGDRIGRKSTLVASLLLMGGSTALIGVLPTFATAGAVAPLLLCLLRFGQGFGLGGEWGGAALLAVENAPPGWRGRYGMFPQFGAPIGFMLATSAFLLMGLVVGPKAFQVWGWRLPFLASLVLVGIGAWVRFKLVETPAFAAALRARPPERLPLGAVLRHHGLACLSATVAVVACFAVYYLGSAFALGYAATVLHVPRTTLLWMQLAASLFMVAGILVGGWISDRYDGRRALLVGYACVLVVAALLAPALSHGSPPMLFAFLAMGFLAAGLTYGPLSAWLPQLFPARVRYTGASLAFNLGGIVGGGLTPLIAQLLAPHGGLPKVGLYLAATVVLSLLPLVFARRAGVAAQPIPEPL